jgi:menaquinone-dependent protoporphyrinogen oxidase
MLTSNACGLYHDREGGESMNSRVLVAFATKHGATTEIAQAIAETLNEMGLAADAQLARGVRTLDEYGAVIIGSAVYMFHWQGDATAFLKRFEHELQARPTWLFSSGPTGGSEQADATIARAAASSEAVPAPKDIAKRAARIGARGHATFPGKIGEGTGGMFEKWVPKGDWRDFDAIKAWARGIGTELRREAAPIGDSTISVSSRVAQQGG